HHAQKQTADCCSHEFSLNRGSLTFDDVPHMRRSWTTEGAHVPCRESFFRMRTGRAPGLLPVAWMGPLQSWLFCAQSSTQARRVHQRVSRRYYGLNCTSADQPSKYRVPQSLSFGAFDKFKLAPALRLQPHAVSHLFRRQPVARPVWLRQIHKWTIGRLQGLQLFVDSCPQPRCEARRNSFDVVKISAAIFADNQR